MEVLNLTVNYTICTEEFITACDFYEWNGQTYTTSGEYTYTVTTISGCDSIVLLNLTILSKIIMPEEIVTICYGDSYIWQGVEYIESGVYKDTLQSWQGCDSILTLNLIVSPVYQFDDTVEIQRGELYQWRGKTFVESGVYFDSLTTEVGCDSIYILSLTVKEVIVDEIIILEQCAGSGVMDVDVLLEQGSVEKVIFEFSQEGIDAGLINTTLPYSEPIEVQYDNVRSGEYNVMVSGLYGDTKVFEKQVNLTFLYPSTVLKQLWNDVIAVLTYDYNGGYNFVEFQWFKNGELLIGETHSYINQQLDFGAEYSALLTEDNGTKLMTCPLIATEHVDVEDAECVDVLLYPTLLDGTQRVKCKVSETSVVYIYDMMGKLILKHNVELGETDLDMPCVAGVYMAKIVTISNIERNVKLIVQ